MTPVIPFEISTRAQQEIKQIIKDKSIPSFYFLRLGLKGSSCGAEFLIGFDTLANTDLKFNYADIEIIIDKKHLMYLAGKIVDFEEGELGQGFTFTDLETSNL